MIEKEILTFLIAHNFLRALMAEAATTHQVPRQIISFKGTLDTIRTRAKPATSVLKSS